MTKKATTVYSILGVVVCAVLLVPLLLPHFASDYRDAALAAAIAEGYRKQDLAVASDERLQGPLFGAFGETANVRLSVRNNEQSNTVMVVLKRSPWSTAWATETVVPGD